jgi:hypothetical protein
MGFLTKLVEPPCPLEGIFFEKNEKCLESPEMARKCIRKIASYLFVDLQLHAKFHNP